MRLLTGWAILAALFLAFLTWGMSWTPALPQQRAICGDRERLTKVLENKYQESVSNMGLSLKSTEAFEIWTSRKGTWTIIMTKSSGQTCIMAAGHSWHTVKQKFLPPENRI